MAWLPTPVSSRERAAALLIVLAFVVLLTGLSVAYLSRTTGDRQVANSSFNQSTVDQLAQSAMDNIIGDLRQEIVDGSANPAPTLTPNGFSVTIYTPTSAAYMVPQRNVNLTGVYNLIRRSVRSDPILSPPARPSRASAVNSTADVSANGRYVTSTRWNGHYLIPKGDVTTSDPSPTPTFNAVTPDWVFVTAAGATPAPAPAPFVTYFLNNSRDFLTVDPTVNSKGRTDQTFSTRGQLIQLVLSIGASANLLQYLGTFSRELNSPTWQSATNPIPQRFQL